MISFGFWNVIIIITVALFLNFNWRLDSEKTAWQDSLFLKHPSIQRLTQFFRQPIVNFILQAVIVLVLTRFLCYIGWLVYNLTNRPDPPYWDFKWFYVASRLAHQHLSPFNVDVFNIGFCSITKVCGFIPSFVYPPNIIPPLWFLGYFPMKTAFTILEKVIFEGDRTFFVKCDRPFFIQNQSCLLLSLFCCCDRSSL